MSGNIRYPNITAQDQAGRLLQMQSYLHQLVDQLNFSLQTIESGTNAMTTVGRSNAPAAQTESEKKLLDSMSNLKSLIIKSANTVRSEMDVLETKLQSTYVAVSNFGTFQEEISTILENTATSLNQTIGYYAELRTLAGNNKTAFEQYVIETEGYIRQGIIGYDGAVPIIGIAIGQDISVTGEKVEVDGQEYDMIDTSSNMAVWTSKKLSFYVYGVEVAYFSNSALYSDEIIVKGSLFLDKNKWEISHTNGLIIKWVGD